MLLRALYLASITFGFAAVAQAPWHLSIALACQGLFSGFIPAAVALVSVSVPDHRLNRSLSTVTGAQYLGNTSGPALGALLSVVFDFRATIIAAALIPVAMATIVLLFVPRDEVQPRQTDDGKEQVLEPFKISRQFMLGILFLFSVYAMNELIRLSTPIALKDLRDGADAATASLITFSLGGLVSAVGVLFLAPVVFRAGALRTAFGAACAFGACGFLTLAVTHAIPLYVLGFMMIAVVISSLVPAINTHIASSVPRSRRGTGFGIAATAQALSFAVGPGGAAFFAAVSLDLGFTVIAGLFVAIGVVMFSLIREQQLVPTAEP
jgi:DHA1 family multidrug resistance protein-like MFS transporter